MRYINPGKAGAAVGAVFGLWHLIWVLLVAVGWAKPVMDFVLKLHFIRLDYELAPFGIGTAAALIALTFFVGALFGCLFAVVWNRLGRATRETRDFKRAAVRS